MATILGSTAFNVQSIDKQLTGEGKKTLLWCHSSGFPGE
jgi:hypothetical protein